MVKNKKKIIYLILICLILVIVSVLKSIIKNQEIIMLELLGPVFFGVVFWFYYLIAGKFDNKRPN